MIVVAPWLIGLSMTSSKLEMSSALPAAIDAGSGDMSDGARLQSVAPSGREIWLDALKVCSVLGVIGIHVTADSAGLPYASSSVEDRLAPALGRSLATIFNYPIFFVASFFLLAGSVRSGSADYLGIVGVRIRRLIPPFLVWSLIYLAFRNVKAIAFGYETYYWQELATPLSWVKYLLIGSAQYHLHFLPTLVLLTLFYPAFNVAKRWPQCALLLPVLLVLWPQLDSFVYEALADRPELLPLALSLTKALGSAGFAFVGFAFYTLHERENSRVAFIALTVGASTTLLASAFILVAEADATARSGEWLARDLPTHLAHYLAPGCVASLFLVLAKRFSSLVWTRLSSLSLGVYLFHPIVLDLLEIVERGWAVKPGPTVVFNFVVVTILSFLVVMSVARVAVLKKLFGVSGSSDG